MDSVLKNDVIECTRTEVSFQETFYWEAVFCAVIGRGRHSLSGASSDPVAAGPYLCVFSVWLCIHDYE